MDKKEFRTLLDAEFTDTAPGKSTIKDWYAKFRYAETSTENGERSGRPKEIVTDENILEIHKMILNDRKLKRNEIAEPLKTSTERVAHIEVYI
ncbi:hypothetical protein GWI33_011734 [Rhynchophorus ferrugineus]|uniref:Transposase n=1 Tax=Rhynchophorus ferrugineus TaxID=354439 RepID=A0A834IQ74_RHYFE|nr:hypothetical protein GWI33_011734 [Rhynchophorus ferrugineus]